MNKGVARVIDGDYQLASELVAVDTTVFFSAINNFGRELWAYHVPASEPAVVTGIDEGDRGPAAYPNPTSGIFTIVVPGKGAPVKFEIVDLLGQTISSGITVGDDTFAVDISDRPSGLYVVRFSQSGYPPVRIVKR